MGAAINVFNFGGGRSRTCRQHPPAGPAINVFNFGGGCCWTCRQHPPGGPPSTSSTLVVDAPGPTDSTPHEARHQRLQLRWWPLLEIPPAPPRGPAIYVFNFGDGHCRTWRWHPQGAAIDISNIGGGRCQICQQHPPGGPPSTSPTPVVAAAGPTASTPKGPTTDVFNFGDGRCLTCRQHPQGPTIHISNFQTSSFGTSQGPAVNAFLSVDGGHSRTFSFGTSRGPTVDY
jgi:hypothetical protein